MFSDLVENSLVYKRKNLREIMDKDENLIKNHGKVYKMPARHTIHKIIDDFAQNVQMERTVVSTFIVSFDENKKPKECPWEVIVSPNWTQDYFDTIFPFGLVFMSERAYIDNFMKKSTEEFMQRNNLTVPPPTVASTVFPGFPKKVPKELLPSNMFGLPHLLRFLVTLEDSFEHSKSEKMMNDCMIDCVNGFVQWLSDHHEEYFDADADYVDAPGDIQLESDAGDLHPPQ